MCLISAWSQAKGLSDPCYIHDLQATTCLTAELSIASFKKYGISLQVSQLCFVVMSWAKAERRCSRVVRTTLVDSERSVDVRLVQTLAP